MVEAGFRGIVLDLDGAAMLNEQQRREYERLAAELACVCRLALVSAASSATIDSFLTVTGSRSLFSSIVNSDDCADPSARLERYARSAESLGADIRECLIVVDAVAGVETARRVGATVVGVVGTCSEEALRNAGADRVCSNLTDVSGCLQTRSRVDPSRWTAVIPAAGRGSRLGFHLPKILYPVGGRLVLDWLLDCVGAGCARLVFVLSPDGAPAVIEALDRRIRGAYDVVVQERPSGMGDAIALALPTVTTRDVAIVWGDQSALRPASVACCLRLHQGPVEPEAICPTVLRANPYVHFVRDAAGRMTSVAQAREGDAMPECGESDTGFFCFRTVSLRRLLQRARDTRAAVGSRTGELNLLPLIPVLANEGVVLTPRVVNVEETIGINAPADVAAVEQFLERRHGGRF
jgi:CTP:molybdopterin cytidylyltransferase MocA